MFNKINTKVKLKMRENQRKTRKIEKKSGNTKNTIYGKTTIYFMAIIKKIKK